MLPCSLPPPPPSRPLGSPRRQWTLGAGISTPEAKGLLKANTAEAVERGVFESPTMLVSGLPGGDGGDGGEHLFFGSDRFEQLAFLAGKPWYGPNPAARPRL